MTDEWDGVLKLQLKVEQSGMAWHGYGAWSSLDYEDVCTLV
jgi:hypothetical protein